MASALEMKFWLLGVQARLLTLDGDGDGYGDGT